MNTGWDWGKIPFELPLEVKRLIQATPVTLLSRGVDKLAWSGSPKGTFDLKSAYRIAMGDEGIDPFPAHFLGSAPITALELRFALRGGVLVMILLALYARKELKAFYMP